MHGVIAEGVKAGTTRFRVAAVDTVRRVADAADFARRVIIIMVPCWQGLLSSSRDWHSTFVFMFFKNILKTLNIIMFW